MSGNELSDSPAGGAEPSRSHVQAGLSVSSETRDRRICLPSSILRVLSRDIHSLLSPTLQPPGGKGVMFLAFASCATWCRRGAWREAASLFPPSCRERKVFANVPGSLVRVIDGKAGAGQDKHVKMLCVRRSGTSNVLPPRNESQRPSPPGGGACRRRVS